MPPLVRIVQVRERIENFLEDIGENGFTPPAESLGRDFYAGYVDDPAVHKFLYDWSYEGKLPLNAEEAAKYTAVLKRRKKPESGVRFTTYSFEKTHHPTGEDYTLHQKLPTNWFNDARAYEAAHFVEIFSNLMSKAIEDVNLSYLNLEQVGNYSGYHRIEADPTQLSPYLDRRRQYKVIVGHELAHGLMFYSKSRGQLTEDLLLVRQYGLALAFGLTGKVKESNFWAIPNIGHPSDDSNEFGASSINVLFNNPETFLHYYNNEEELPPGKVNPKNGKLFYQRIASWAYHRVDPGWKAFRELNGSETELPPLMELAELEASLPSDTLALFNQAASNKDTREEAINGLAEYLALRIGKGPTEDDPHPLVEHSLVTSLELLGEVLINRRELLNGKIPEWTTRENQLDKQGHQLGALVACTMNDSKKVRQKATDVLLKVYPELNPIRKFSAQVKKSLLPLLQPNSLLDNDPPLISAS